MSFLELEHFGINTSTVAFIGTTIFAIYGAWGLWMQIGKVKRNGGKAVSVIWQMTLMMLFTSFLIYGAEQHRLALILQFFCRTPFYACLLWLLWKWKPFDRIEWAFLGGLTILLVSLCLYNKGLAVIIFNYMGAAFTLAQPIKMWRLKSAGSVEIKLIWAYFASAIFWLIYGWATSDTSILWAMIIYFLIQLGTISLYYKYAFAETTPA